ncbi:MAG: sodium-coupled permease, partial [Candidatus Omnitrophica bacterium]|nr:sodium-coupled permease [Candidatus Omnitrophota bacterium]
MTGLVAIDWMIILVYATSTIALGWYFGRKQETTKEYFVGSGNMNWFLIGVSLFATLLSTISYLSMPGEVIGKGPVAMVRILALPITFLVVGYFLVPVYMRQRV